MSYSSITKKKCKCGCNRYPSFGYAGYSYNCAPQEIKEKVGNRTKVAQKNKNNRLALGRKLHEVQRNNDAQDKEVWFAMVRKKLVGVCQCGCGNKSQKNDDMYFRHSCCHIFAKSKFPTIQYHPLNYVERAFFGGCHGVLDDTSMDRWVNMADWCDIKEKFYILAPLLSDEERTSKFYNHLERLVYGDLG